MAKEKMDKEYCEGHMKKKGLMMLILGLLILGNAYYSVASWSIFIGVIVAVAGFLKLIIPHKY